MSIVSPFSCPMWQVTMSRIFTRALALSTMWMLLAPLAVAQNKTITVRETFEPSFHIEPLVAKLSGRRGETLKFEFLVEAINKDADIDVALVDLRQEITGQVIHDDAGKSRPDIQLVNPGKAQVQRNVPYRIQGLVRVPAGDASYYSFGVLVKDIGKAPDTPPKTDSNGRPSTSAGIRFVTQYVLRIDVHVEGARGDNAGELSLEDGKLTSSRGLPKISVIIRNPSDSSFEYEVKSKLKPMAGPPLKPVRLVMPVRASMESEERFIGRVMPKSSVRMEETVPEPIVDGQYQMDVDLLIGGRVVKQRTFTITADSNDFPAQQVLLGSAGQDLYVAPVYLELSQLRGGQRRLTMEFHNTSSETRQIQLNGETLRGTPLANVIIQPSEFTLGPRSKRKLSLTMRGVANPVETVEYGHIVIMNKSSVRDYSESGRLPIALHYAPSPDPKLELEGLRWVEGDKYNSFKARVNNVGTTHARLDAQLTIEAPSGQRMRIPAGFGRWIMPGQSIELDFRLDAPLAPGPYRLSTELQQGPTPIIRTQEFTVTDISQKSR